MYSLSLTVHSWLRWLVLAAALVVITRAIAGLVRRKPWSPGDQTAARAFIAILDVQVLIGLLIYAALSPFTIEAWGDMRETMRNAPLRFIAIEHPVGMLVAVTLAHVGAGRLRRATDLVRRQRTALIFFGLALVVMLISVPWPGTPAGRPLLRGVTGITE